MSKIRWRLPAAVRSYLLFERFTTIDPDEMLRRRAGWPTWRRMLRLVGATAWWLGAVISIARGGANATGLLFAFQVVLACVVGICVVLGTGLEWRDRHRMRHRVAGYRPPAPTS